MLELKNIRAGYGDEEVIHDISFNFMDGENYCLLGPNGCGKTTLIRVMASLMDFKGEVLFSGKSMKDMKRREIAGNVAVLSQMSQVYFSYSVYDTVMLGRYQYMKGRLFSGPGDEDRAKVEECLKTVDLWEQRDRRINELSGGQRQRVFLAQVLAQNPKMILLDEPTNHLDIRYQLELIDYIKSWTSDGDHTVIGVLHDINLALKLSENIILMDDGRIRAWGKFTDIADGELLKEIYKTDIVTFMKESFDNWSRI